MAQFGGNGSQNMSEPDKPLSGKAEASTLDDQDVEIDETDEERGKQKLIIASHLAVNAIAKQEAEAKGKRVFFFR